MTAGQFLTLCVSYAVQAWLIVLIAILLGRYARRGVRMPASTGGKAKLVLVAYLSTVVALAVMEATAASMGPIFTFLLPLIIGAVVARSLMARVSSSQA